MKRRQEKSCGQPAQMVSPEASDGVPQGDPPRKARKGWLKVTVDRFARGALMRLAGRAAMYVLRKRRVQQG